MAQRLKNLRVTRVALCGKGMNQEAEIALFKAVPAAEPSDIKEAEVADETIETVAKAEFDEVVAERDALKAQLAEKPDPIEIDKSELPEAVVKALDEAAELRTRVAKMEREQRAATFVKKAEEFGHIAGAAELGPVLEAIDRACPDEAKLLDQYLKAANARINESGLFKELGSDGEPAGDDPTAQTEALVKKYMDDEKLSRPDAIRKVFTERPELWQEAKSAR